VVAAKCVAKTAGSHIFRATSDDGLRLFYNDVLSVDDFTVHTVATYTLSSVTLAVGDEVLLVAYYFNNGGASGEPI
jgi:hypothetical protein